MAKINQDFEMFQADTKELHVTVTDEDGNLVDLTGAKITWKMYKSFSSPVAVLKDTLAGGITVPDPLSGVFVVTLNEVDTETLSGGFNHEAQVQDIRGMVTTVMTGNIKIKQKHS